MADSGAANEGRRALIAESGIRIISRDGVRALTHRAIDREAGLPQGSSSYYVPTRKALIDLIIEVLAHHSIVEAEQVATALGEPQCAEIEDLSSAVSSLIAVYASRPAEMRARYALLLELNKDDPARTTLSSRSPVQQAITTTVANLLDNLGVRDAKRHASALIALTDALLTHRIITDDETVDLPLIINNYLHGIISIG